MRKVGIAGLVLALLPLAGAAAGSPPPADPAPLSAPDMVLPTVPPPRAGFALGAWSPYDADPLGLVNVHDQMQLYSQGTDSWEVWICDNVNNGSTIDFADFWSVFATDIIPYFEYWSEGRYTPSFFQQGTVSVGSNNTDACANQVANASPGTHNGAFIVTDWSFGGLGGPGVLCPWQSCGSLPTTYPDNDRTVWVGRNSMMSFPNVPSHEVGHALSWPHTPSGTSHDYDNPIDLMSGNSTIWGGTEPMPYATLAFNRYAAGWIDPTDVVIVSGPMAVDLGSPSGAHEQMLVIPTPTQGVFYALSARRQAPFDPIPVQWEGVEVYYVDQWCGGNPFSTGCPSLWRTTTQYPASPGGVGHILQPGDSIVLEGVTVAVTADLGDGFRVSIDGGAPCVAGFCDIAGSLFVDDIVWLAGAGITTGCNPPANNLFCPTDAVSRAQMATFLARFLGLPPPSAHQFTDIAASVHRDNIESLREAGVTSGCNPPANDHFCPGDSVSRAQMATFLARALSLVPSATDWFSDDAGSVHEANINSLADAGITTGCAPGVFCPAAAVTREQMAAFLHRAL